MFLHSLFEHVLSTTEDVHFGTAATVANHSGSERINLLTGIIMRLLVHSKSDEPEQLGKSMLHHF